MEKAKKEREKGGRHGFSIALIAMGTRVWTNGLISAREASPDKKSAPL